jgi:hypothetical protein
MTKEEIRQAAQDWDGSGMATPAEEGAFIAGVEWMQEKMIKKACEWLYVYYPTLERSKSFEDAWKHFKKAMQDESK